MSEHSVRVVFSGHGEQQVQLRLHSAAADRPVVVQVASLGALTPRLEDAANPQVGPSSAPPTLSLELRWSEPPPAPPPPVASQPAPLASAWALSQRLRERQAAAATAAPRRRSARTGSGRA